MPRISSSVCPGPLLLMETPGTDCTTELMSVMPRSPRSRPVSAVMLIGVSCTVDTRFCAVTTISCSWSDLVSCCATATPLTPNSAVAGTIVRTLPQFIIRMKSLSLDSGMEPIVGRMLHQNPVPCTIKVL